MFKKLIIFLSITLIMTIFSGCNEKNKIEQTINYSIRNIQTLDSQQDALIEVGYLSMHIFDRLVEIDKTGKLYPSLIKKMPVVSTDNLTYTFELKNNIQFTNGSKLKSSDVKFTFERMLLPETKGTSTWIVNMIDGAQDIIEKKSKTLKGFKIIDDFKFEIHLSNPYTPFLNGLGTPYASIYPEKACIELGDKWSKQAIGSGPFKVAKWDVNKQIILEKNNDYFGKKPKIDKIVHRFVADPAENQALFELNNNDVYQVPSDKYADYKKDSKYQNYLNVTQAYYTRYLVLNNENKILKDPRVRQAISISIDRDKFCNTVLKEAAAPAYTFLPKGLDGYDKDARIEYNPKKAKELLKQAGYPNGLTLDYYQLNHEVFIMDLSIQSMLEQSGIKLNLLDKVKDTELAKAKKDGTFTMSLVRWCADIADADNFLYNLFNSSQNKVSKYKNKEFDTLSNKARIILDPIERANIYKTLDKKICQQDWGTVPVSHDLVIMLFSPKLKGAYVNPVTNFMMFHDAFKE